MSEFSKKAVDFFHKKIGKQPPNEFNTVWSMLALASITSFLDSLFFVELKTESGGYGDVFFKNQHKLTSDNFIKLCQIMVRHYLSAFLKNPNNTNLIKAIYHGHEDIAESFFRAMVLDNFSFSESDILLYNNLKEHFTINLYSELMNTIGADNYKNPYNGIAFEIQSLSSYELFFNLLNERIEKEIKQNMVSEKCKNCQHQYSCHAFHPTIGLSPYKEGKNCEICDCKEFIESGEIEK